MTPPPVGHEARLKRLEAYYQNAEEILNQKCVNKRFRPRKKKGRGRPAKCNAANYIQAGEADKILMR